jgi:hypothetical protein
MSSSPIFFDSLESRTLLNGYTFVGGGGSFSGGLWLPTLPANPSPTVQADYNKAVADKTAVQTDQTNIANDLKALGTAIATSKTTNATQLATLQAKLAADEAAEQTALAADQAAVKAVYTADQPAITADLIAIVNDIKTANTTQLATDKTQLATDIAKLKADLAAPLATLKADDATADAAEQADEQAIHDLIFNDPGVVAAEAQLKADQAVYTTDLKTFIADRTQLLTDLKNGV